MPQYQMYFFAWLVLSSIAFSSSALAQTSSGDDEHLQAIKAVIVTALRSEGPLMQKLESVNVFTSVPNIHAKSHQVEESAHLAREVLAQQELQGEDRPIIIFIFGGIGQIGEVATSVIKQPKQICPPARNHLRSQWYDIERIIFMKSPQNVLVGRDHIGRRDIAIIRSPTNKFFCKLLASYEDDFNERTIPTALNLPAVEHKLLVRLSG